MPLSLGESRLTWTVRLQSPLPAAGACQGPSYLPDRGASPGCCWLLGQDSGCKMLRMLFSSSRNNINDSNNSNNDNDSDNS